MQWRWLIPLGTLPALHSAYAAVYMTAEQAQKEAFPSATTFEPGPGDAARPGLATWEARDAQGRLGWLLVDNVVGRTELITYSLALDAAGKILALDVLEYRETHGSEIHLPAWRKQFVGHTPANAPKFGDDVRNIVGATLSCRHVTDGVAQLLAFFARTLATH